VSTPTVSRHLLAAVPEAGLRATLSDRLRTAGYAVTPVGSGAEAMAVLSERPVDLIIVDVDIPDIEDLARRRPVLAERPPVLCMTRCEDLESLVPEVGLDIEDYVTKPFRVAELLARVRVLLRTRRLPMPGMRHGDLVLDEAACRVWRGGRRIDVTAAEFRLLRFLLQNSGQVLSKEQLAWQIWHETRGVNAIERLVSRLRQKIDATGPALIHTRRGFGYTFGEV
jgi:DNA-binding response OmpR family regulator